MPRHDAFERSLRFLKSMHHYVDLGMQLQSVGPGKAVIVLPYDERLIGDPDTKVIHGGAVSALLDTCAGTAVSVHPEMRSGIATLALNISYMRPAQPGLDITARAECFHMGRNIAFIRASASDGEASRPLATATGQFAV